MEMDVGMYQNTRDIIVTMISQKEEQINELMRTQRHLKDQLIQLDNKYYKNCCEANKNGKKRK